MNTEDRIKEEKRDAAEGEAIYWNRMADVAGRKRDFMDSKLIAIKLEIECWEFQKIEAAQNARSSQIAVEQHEIRLERQKEQIEALKMIEGM